LGQPIDDARLMGLTQNFSPTLFQDSARQWFPGLFQEVSPEQYSPASDFIGSAQGLVAQVEQELETDATRLVLPHDFLARLLPSTMLDNDRRQELLSENPLAGLYGASQTPLSSNTPGGLASGQVSSMPNQPPTTGLSPPSRQVDPINHEDPNILAPNPLANYGSRASETKPEWVTNQDAVSGGMPQTAPVEDQVVPLRVGQSAPTDSDGSADSDGSIGPIAISPAEDAATYPAAKPDRAGQFKPVGWVRDDAKFAIQYHLQGHADPWMKEWLDLLVQRQRTTHPDALIAHLMGSIAAPEKAGNCLQCHGDHNGDTLNASVSWTGQYRDPTLKGWTKFNHRPHTLLPGLSDCRSCHQLRETAPGQRLVAAAVAERLDKRPNNAEFVGFSRVESPGKHSSESHNAGQMKRHSDFHSITKSQCASCHQAGSTRNSCTTCHNYHIGQRVQK